MEFSKFKKEFDYEQKPLFIADSAACGIGCQRISFAQIGQC
jgi:hypothetical protein